MSKKQDKKEEIRYSFDLEGSQEPEKRDLKSELVELEKKVALMEKVIRENGLGHNLGQVISDEEYICIKGIDTIKKLMINEIQTKDDVNMFDVLYRNLCIIRGIKVDKKPKEKPKTKDELYGLITGGKV